MEVTLEKLSAIGVEEVQNDKVTIKRSDWTPSGKALYQERSVEWDCEKMNTEEIWEELKEKITGAVTKKEIKFTPWKVGERKWHNKEWKERKRELRSELRKMKKGKLNREEFLEIKKAHKEWCKEARETGGGENKTD